MRVSGVFNRILDLPDTVVGDVTMDARGHVIAQVEVRGQPRCGMCGDRASVYDHRQRRWRHLDVVHRHLWLSMRVCRVSCRSCGVTTQQVPWARHGARHTIAFEHEVAWLTQRCDKTTVATLLRIGWATIGVLVDRVVTDRLPADRLDGLRRIGVDEISYRFGHRYLTIVADHDTGRVVWVAEGRTAASFATFFEALGPDRCRQLEAISMDMSSAYHSAARQHAPQAAICLDPFHVIQWAGRALDQTFSDATRGRQRLGLTGKAWTSARFMLRRAQETLTGQQLATIDELRQQRFELFEAWDLKESLRDLYRLPAHQAPDHFDAWITAARQARSPAMARLAERLATHRPVVLNAITHKLSNSRLEGINGQIRLIHRRGYGYHTAHALAALIYLCCGRLDLPPPTRT